MNFDEFAICTDLYQLTMAQGYWKLGKHNEQAVFELFFRELPFKGGYAICCGLEPVVEMIQNYKFTAEYCNYLAMLKGSDGHPLFAKEFLKALLALRLHIDMDAIPEGTLVFPKEPLLRVTGPLWECQLLETILLNFINFSTLIATKAARICYAAGLDSVVEFGLRRAQGPNGGLMASRAAFIGGVGATSNALAGYRYGIPVAGTHAHSWVLSFPSEQESFESYAKVMPNNCIFLVDTYSTLQGIEQAIEVGNVLKKQGHKFLGIRLDSGNLAELSILARKRLDESGFSEAQIVGSNDLDEYSIEKLKKEGAKISIWGVGTRLATAYDQPALGGIYKLVALRNQTGKWEYKAKKTDDPKKQTLSGIHGVRRFMEKDFFENDLIYNIHEISPLEKKSVQKETVEELLVPVFKRGELIYSLPPLSSIRKRSIEQLLKLPAPFKKLKPDNEYKINLRI